MTLKAAEDLLLIESWELRISNWELGGDKCIFPCQKVPPVFSA